MTLSRRSLFAGAAGVLTSRMPGASKVKRPGCQANGWQLDPARFDLLLTAVREIKELGFQGFETNIRFVQPQLSRASEARAELEQIGLALSKTGEFSEEALQRKARMLNLAAKRCGDAGLTLAYHNHQPEFTNHAAEELGLLRATDSSNVFFVLDIGHAWLADPDAIQVFAANAQRVFGLHLHDFRNGESVPLGQGEFPLRQLAEAIRKTGWGGWLIDEEEGVKGAPTPGKKAAGPSRKTMKEVFEV